MYLPAHFAENRPELMHGLMRAHPLATLVSSGPGGLLATPLPVLVYPEESEQGVLRAHFARANPHWRELAGGGECLVIFQGLHGYVSPSWYPGKQRHHKVVPTWNYATVQVWGRPVLAEDPNWLRRQVQDLTTLQEASRPRPWRVDDAPADYIAAQLKAIVGVEITIVRMEGKWKLSQNRDEADKAGVVAGLRAAGDPHGHPALADLVEERRRG